jgi:hypothetical protein
MSLCVQVHSLTGPESALKSYQHQFESNFAFMKKQGIPVVPQIH